MSQSGKFDLLRPMNFVASVPKAVVRRYLKYWNTIAPRDDEAYYLCWIFAFMSIHTTWKKNVEGFLAVKNLQRPFTWLQLYNAIRRSKCGLTRMRTHAVYDFHRRFWNDPSWWYPQADETMVECRDRLAGSTWGIKLTKVSFALELAFPATCGVVCLDTHILQLYNYYRKDTPNPALYHEMERHWLAACTKRGVPSPIVRHIYWDRVQKKPDTRYWSHVLEKEEAA